MRILATALFSLALMTSVSATNYTVFSSEIGSSAETIGMGNIGGFGSSASTLFENPASLYRIKNVGLSGFYTDFILGEVKFMQYSAAFRFGPGILAAGIMDTHVNDIPITGSDSNNEYTLIGTDSYQNSIYKVGYQIDLQPNFHLGLASTYYSQKIVTANSSGFNLDLGAVLEFNKLSLSLAVQNIVKPLAINYSNGNKETLPTLLTFGGKYLLTPDLALLGQIKINDLGSNSKYLKAVGIKWAPAWLNNTFYLSSGWNEFQVLDSLKNKGSLGVGLNISALSFQFAFEKSDYFEQENQYYLSTQINF